jgi:hypothetical protein
VENAIDSAAIMNKREKIINQREKINTRFIPRSIEKTSSK